MFLGLPIKFHASCRIGCYNLYDSKPREKTNKQLTVSQHWSTKWGCYVDSTRSEIVDGNRVAIREHFCRPSDGQQPKDAVSPGCMTLASYVAISHSHIYNL